MAIKFMLDTLCEEVPANDTTSIFTEEELDQLYCEQLDKTGSGRVSKLDMVQFFKNVAGI